VGAAGAQILPPFVASSSAGSNQTRTLVLRQDGTALSYSVLRDSDPVLGEPELTEASSATHALNGVVASLGAATGGNGGDAGQALSQFDIGYVLLPAPIDQTLARQLNGAAGLVRLTTAPAYDLWQVAGTVARARVLTSDGTALPVSSGPLGVNTEVTPATSGTLILAEAAGGWTATLNGRPLTALNAPVDGWAQGFVLPAGGGRLVITRDDLARDLSLAAEAVAVAVVFALALPGTRSAVPAPAAGETEPETVPAPGRRRDRAGGTKPGGRRQRPQLAFAASRTRGSAADSETRPQTAPTGPLLAELPAAAPPDPWIPAAAADTEIPSAASTGPGTGPIPAEPRRPRGGQHAARHGKPSKRWRGPAKPSPKTTRSAEEQPPPALENLDPFPVGDADVSPWTTPDPMPAAPRAPWESGDRP
jgi:hypothetical protein